MTKLWDGNPLDKKKCLKHDSCGKLWDGHPSDKKLHEIGTKNVTRHSSNADLAQLLVSQQEEDPAACARDEIGIPMKSHKDPTNLWWHRTFELTTMCKTGKYFFCSLVARETNGLMPVMDTADSMEPSYSPVQASKFKRVLPAKCHLQRGQAYMDLLYPTDWIYSTSKQMHILHLQSISFLMSDSSSFWVEGSKQCHFPFCWFWRSWSWFLLSWVQLLGWQWQSSEERQRSST